MPTNKEENWIIGNLHYLEFPCRPPDCADWRNRIGYRTESDVPYAASVYKLKQGDNVMRVWPFIKGKMSPVKDLYKYFKLLPTNEPLIALDKTFGLPDPVAAALKHISRTTGQDVSQFEPKYSGALLAWVRDIEYETEPCVVFIPYSVKKWLTNTIAAIGTGFLSPETGTDVVITRTGEGLDTRYTCSLAGDPRNRGAILKMPEGTPNQVAMEKLCKKIPDLDILFAPRTDDEMMKKYQLAAQTLIAQYKAPPMGVTGK